MKRWLPPILIALLLVFAQAPARAEAHPLGNFTVNQYSRLEVGRDNIRVRYIVDMAEIPAFQERQSMDGNGDGQVSDAESAAYLAQQSPTLLAGLIDGEVAERVRLGARGRSRKHQQQREQERE